MEQAEVAAMKDRIRKEVTEAVKEFGDVIEEISRDYAQLKVDSEKNGPQAAVEITVDVLLENIKLPWQIPTSVARAALVAAISKAVEERTKAAAGQAVG